ncbi:MAG: hypothetical protein ABI045_06800 [Flavobacteriales bacterium]
MTMISCYALAHMDKNNIPANIRLWFSIDESHQGVNISIGD